MAPPFFSIGIVYQGENTVSTLTFFLKDNEEKGRRRDRRVRGYGNTAGTSIS